MDIQNLIEKLQSQDNDASYNEIIHFVEDLGHYTTFNKFHAEEKELKKLLSKGYRIARNVDDYLITFSKNYFIPVSRACQNDCLYCNFKKPLKKLTAEELLYPLEKLKNDLRIAKAHGCKEILFCGGEAPDKFGLVKERLIAEGIKSGMMLDWLKTACEMTLEKGLLPHTNVGILTMEELSFLKDLNASMGLMLETSSNRLMEKGMVHHESRGKNPRLRIEMIKNAGKLQVPFTTGILVGIGETFGEIVDSLLVIREIQAKFNHVQEVIIQGVDHAPAKARKANVKKPTTKYLSFIVAVARVILQKTIKIQVPPNLMDLDAISEMLAAGASDIGGLSPVTIDHVNPESPWPDLEIIKAHISKSGFKLIERLPVHSKYITLLGKRLKKTCLALQAKS
ncbi:MAG: 7,8-didemethyl-8-hydroxy-5-deazariboflavin synthase subunit CofG [Promethearchaeota archaeon]